MLGASSVELSGSLEHVGSLRLAVLVFPSTAAGISALEISQFFVQKRLVLTPLVPQQFQLGAGQMRLDS